MQKKKVTLSFSGCGFLGIYHVGVASCFREFEEYFEVEKIAGASAGAIAAASYLCGVCLGQATTDVLNIARAARASPVGPLSPRFNLVKIIRNGLQKVLPENAHKICSGRLSISLTRCHDRKNRMVTEFASKDDLIQVLICSSFVPFYSGMIPPYYDDARYWDGGITNNLPTFDDATVTISPFSGESDICPADSSAAFLEMNFANHSLRVNTRNIYRVSRALFPPHPEALSEICREGYADTLRYIKNVLLCGIPLRKPSDTPQPVIPEREPVGGSEKNGPEINSIVSVHPQESEAPPQDVEPPNAVVQTFNETGLPVLVSDAFREACASKQHPAIRAVQYMTIPWVLPLEFMYTTCVRLVELTPFPRTMELEYYVELFSGVAQRIAYKLLSNHRTGSWLKCACNLESVKMSISADKNHCYVHGGATLHHSRSVTFAFAMSIEETVTADPSTDDFLEFAKNKPVDYKPSMEVVHHEKHPGEIKLLMDDSDTFEEVVAVLQQHDDEMVEYFEHLLQAPQPPLVIATKSADLALADHTGVVVMEIDDQMGSM
ncbi:patatin-like phospholipase domain-containing protein 2 [Paramacrobiotus metropolitanus]|uniref:patatin-like phospholipase domain-containing protein 2 n=1 Tax=Paramacrobiotus metropolitanus TaxID=2943436 RepID=UPI0024462D32|nr:patatin-like phospholipase domain-containing protein 2 [Paramacrobiotus metropolitanus]